MGRTCLASDRHCRAGAAGVEAIMLDKKTIRERLASRKAEMVRMYGVTKIGLFGSFVRGDQRDDSDVDIVVELESENMFRAFFGLKRYLEHLLGRSVDLGLEHALKPAVRERVAKEIIYV